MIPTIKPYSSSVCKPLKSLEIWTSTLIIKVSRTGVVVQDIMYLRSVKAARSAKYFWEEIFMPKSQLGGILYIFPPGPRGGGCLYFPLKHKSAMYTFVQQRGGGSRRDPNHKSMYKCAYMYVHLSLSPPPPAQ